MDWDLIRAFLAIAKAGGIRAAGRNVGVPAAGLLRKLDALEAQMGVALFHRSARGLTLTSAGDALLPHARQMSETASRIRAITPGLRSGGGLTLRIACGEWSSPLLTQAAVGFGARHDMCVEIGEMHGEPADYTDDPDLFVRHGLPGRAAGKTTKLGDLPAAIYASRAYLARHPDAADPARWPALDWVGWDKPHRFFLSYCWLVERVPEQRIRVRSSRTQLQRLAMVEGAGLGVLPCHMAAAEPELVAVTRPIPDLAADVWAIYQEPFGNSLLGRRTLAWLRGVIRQAGRAEALPAAAE